MLHYGAKIPLKEGESRFRGGCIVDHGHNIDMIRWLTGREFEKVYAESASNIRDWLPVEDNAQMIGQLDNGIVVSNDPSWSRPEEFCKEWGTCYYRIIGTDGAIEVDAYGRSIFLNHEPPYDQPAHIKHSSYISVGHTSSGWAENFADWLKHIEEDKEFHPNEIDALRVSEVINAQYESIKEGKPVRVSRRIV